MPERALAWKNFPNKASENVLSETNHAKWTELRGKVRRWADDPDQLADDDFDPPTAEVLERTLILMDSLSSGGFPPPDAVTPTGDGGIAFERRHNGVFETIEITTEGAVDYYVIEGGKMIHRNSLSVGPVPQTEDIHHR